MTGWWWAACSASTTPACPSIPRPVAAAVAVNTTPAAAVRGRTMDFSKFFIDRPIFAVVLSIIMFAVGSWWPFRSCRWANIPRSCRPAWWCAPPIREPIPRRSPESVAVPLEEAISRVEGLMYMKSVAASDGSLRVVATFRPGNRPRHRRRARKNRVSSQAQSRLPEEVRQFGVTTQKQASTPLMYVGLNSSDGKS